MRTNLRVEMVNPNRFYTYAYLREDRTPYYIGKGQGKRAYNKRQRGVNPPRDKSRIIFLKQNLTEEEAFKHEIYMIAVFGRKCDGGILLNKSIGGEGSSGATRSEETRKKMSERQKGEKNSYYGKSPSEETRKKMSESHKGEKNPNYGKSRSEETRKKMSESLKGKCGGEKHYLYGKSLSEETKRKISESNKDKKWWNDGEGNIKFTKECPGKNWIPGRGHLKTGSPSGIMVL